MITQIAEDQAWLADFLEKNNLVYEDIGFAGGRLLIRTKSYGLEDYLPEESPNGTPINICVII